VKSLKEKRKMNKILFYIINISAALVITIINSYTTDPTFLKEFYFNFISIISGLLVAVVGIFLGTISLLQNRLKRDYREDKVKENNYNNLSTKLSQVKKEIKDNLFIVIFFYLFGSMCFLIMNSTLQLEIIKLQTTAFSRNNI
jgi:hypothetical protein